MIDLEPHPLASLFPPIPEEELAELGRDIALHGQLEPIVLYQDIRVTYLAKIPV